MENKVSKIFLKKKLILRTKILSKNLKTKIIVSDFYILHLYKKSNFLIDFSYFVQSIITKNNLKHIKFVIKKKPIFKKQFSKKQNLFYLFYTLNSSFFFLCPISIYIEIGHDSHLLF